MPRRRYLDKAAPADATYNSIRPVYRNIQVKKKDTPQRRESEAAKARARAEQARVTPANPRQASVGPYREKTAIDKAGGRLYAAAEQRAKDAQDREAAGVVLNSLFKPIMPSTYVDMYDAYKRGEVNNVTDALAAPYITGSWSQRNPGRALALDLIAPVAGSDIVKSYKAMRAGLKNPRLGIVADPRHPSGFRFSPEEKKLLQQDAINLPKVIHGEVSDKLEELAFNDFKQFANRSPAYSEPQTYAKYLNEVHGLNVDTKYGVDSKFYKHYKHMYQPLKSVSAYPSSPTSKQWDKMFEQALDEGNIERLNELRLAHHRVAVLQDNPGAVRFPFVHTVSDRYNPAFNAFDTAIEGRNTYVYGTPVNEKNIAMSSSYASANALRKEPNRIKRLLGHLNNPFEFNANKANWNRLPVPLEKDELVDNKVISNLMNRLNEKVQGITSYINSVPEYSDFNLPKFNYGDSFNDYVNKIRYKLENAKFDPEKVYKHHKAQYDARLAEKNKAGYYEDPYNLNWYLESPFVTGYDLVRRDMLSPTVLHDIMDDAMLPPGDYGNPYYYVYKPVTTGQGNYVISGEHPMSTRQLEENLVNQGTHDGFIIDNIYDYGGLSADESLRPEAGTVYGIQNPKHIKSANVLTYDNNGKLIPLSRRDNFNINDIRYGLAPFAISTLGLGLYNRR